MLAGVLGDLWNWVAGVFERIGDVSPYWLVVALALKTCESAFLGLTWRNTLRAAYPKGGLSFKTRATFLPLHRRTTRGRRASTAAQAREYEVTRP